MLKLVQIDAGVFDLQFDDPSLNDADSALATLIYTVLFTDAEAPIDRVKERFDRRGWWADVKAGTGIWYVRRQALSSNAKREALAMIKRALDSHSPALSQIVVSEQLAPAGSVSSLFVNISGRHNGVKFLFSTPL